MVDICFWEEIRVLFEEFGFLVLIVIQIEIFFFIVFEKLLYFLVYRFLGSFFLESKSFRFKVSKLVGIIILEGVREF